jgi:hypothetical protein
MSFKYSPQQLFNKISGSLAAGSNVTLTNDGSTITIASTGGGGGSSTNAFATASVSGQSDIIANSATGAITFANGNNVSITTNASTDTLTINATQANSFSTIAVSGQSNVVAGSATDTLTLVAGSNITITTDAGADSVTINASGGGGGTTYNQWDAMAPPGTANALDDEFTGSLSGWSTWNAGSVTFSAQTQTAQQMLVLDCDTVPGDRLVGIYKAAPTASSGDYTYAFWSKVSWVSLDASDYPNVGIFIAEDIAGSPTTAKAWNCVVAREGSRFQVRAQGWNNYTSYGGAVTNDIYRSFSYLRIRVSYASSGNTTTYNFDHSGDGVGWYQLVQRTYTGHLPYIGFLMNNVNGSDNLQGWCDFFRVYDDYEFYYPPSGSLVERTLA